MWPVVGWEPEGKNLRKDAHIAEINYDPLVAHSALIVLYLPGTEKETPWHHDQAYYPVDGEAVVSIWMPVGRDIG